MSPRAQGRLVAGAMDRTAAAEWIRSADRVLIGAGAGLSAAAGFDYTDTERFAELFPALRAAGLRARYELIGLPLPPRHQWGFWAVHVDDIRLGAEPSPIYSALREVVAEREHFVISSNVDALFTRNGFAEDRVYTPQGDYALYQCLTPCTRDVWDARPVIRRALDSYDPRTGQVAEDAVPACPRCGGPVHLNVYAGAWYINDHFLPQLDRLNHWLDETAHAGETLAILEIGCGFNTPGVVRWPMEQIARSIPRSRLVRANRDDASVPLDLSPRAASLEGDAREIIASIASTAP